MNNQPHRTQPDRKPPPAQNSQSDPNSPPLPGPRPADGHTHRGHRQNFGPRLTGLDRSHRKRSKPRSHGPGPRGGPPRFKLQPLYCLTSLSHHPDPGSRRGCEHSGAWELETEKGLPSPEAGKGLACPVVLASVGIRECEGPGYMPNTLLLREQPNGHPIGHVHGMDGRCYRKRSFEQVGLAGGLH